MGDSTTSLTNFQASGLTASPGGKVLHTDPSLMTTSPEKTVSQEYSQAVIPKSATAVDLSSRKAQPALPFLTQQNGHQHSSVTLSGGQAGLNGDDPSLGMRHKVKTASGGALQVTESLSQPKAQAQKIPVGHLLRQHPSGRPSHSTWWGITHGVSVFQPLLRHCQHIACSMTQTLQAVSSQVDSLSTKQLKVCHGPPVSSKTSTSHNTVLELGCCALLQTHCSTDFQALIQVL